MKWHWLLLSLGLSVMLQGCFFFYIPGSMLSAMSGYNTCAGERAYVGQRIRHHADGRVGKLVRISGRSERCQDGRWPILVEVDYESGT